MHPFQDLSIKDLPEVFRWFVTSWVFFGIPSILAIFLIRCFLKRFTHRFRSVAICFPLLALLLGSGAGYFEAWICHHDFNKDQRWYEAFAFFGAPGDSMANSYAGDWQDDEAWNYRNDIAIWNGLFWVTVAAAGVFVIRPTSHTKLQPA